MHCWQNSLSNQAQPLRDRSPAWAQYNPAIRSVIPEKAVAQSGEFYLRHQLFFPRTLLIQV